MHSIVKTYSLRQAAHEWEDNHNCRIISPSQRETFRTPQQVPQSKDPSPGRQAPRTPASGLPFRRVRGLWEMETPRLECTQTLTCSESRHMGSGLKGAWSNFLANLGEPPRGEGGNWDSQRGHRCWGQSFGGTYFTTRTLMLRSTISESPLWIPSALYPPAGWHQHTENSWPCHYRRAMQPTEEAPLHHVGVTTRESAAVVGYQLHGGLRRHNQPTPDTNTELGKMKRQNYVLN